MAQLPQTHRTPEREKQEWCYIEQNESGLITHSVYLSLHHVEQQMLFNSLWNVSQSQLGWMESRVRSQGPTGQRFAQVKKYILHSKISHQTSHRSVTNKLRSYTWKWACWIILFISAKRFGAYDKFKACSFSIFALIKLHIWFSVFTSISSTGCFSLFSLFKTLDLEKLFRNMCGGNIRLTIPNKAKWGKIRKHIEIDNLPQKKTN